MWRIGLSDAAFHVEREGAEVMEGKRVPRGTRSRESGAFHVERRVTPVTPGQRGASGSDRSAEIGSGFIQKAPTSGAAPDAPH